MHLPQQHSQRLKVAPTILHRPPSTLNSNRHPPRIRPILRMDLSRLKQRLQTQSPTSIDNRPGQRILHRLLNTDSPSLLATPPLIKIDRVYALKVLILGLILCGTKLRALWRGRRSHHGDVRGVDV